MADSSKVPDLGKPSLPSKPDADFPLFPHRSGRWAKKVRQKFRFYGRWGKTVAGQVVPFEDQATAAAEALAEFNRCWAWHKAGKEAPPIDADASEAIELPEGPTLATLTNAFMNSKQTLLKNKELSAHTFSEYYRACQFLVGVWGRDKVLADLTAEDFSKLRDQMAKGCKLVTLKSKINRARVIFKFAYDADLIDKPFKFSGSFDRPSSRKLRAEKQLSGPNLFSREEILSILDALDGKPIAVDEKIVTWPASATMRAMVLLGLNAGFGNTDCASLPKSAVNLKARWITFPRTKTAVERRIPLWKETAEAITKAISERPAAEDPLDDDLCFLTERGTRFVRIQQSKNDSDRFVTINSLSRRFEQLLDALGIGQRKGIGFYTLRHVFETIAGGCRDQIAVDLIMGHVDSSMSANYRHEIGDDRLLDAVNHVHGWLWPMEKPAKKKATKAR